MQGIFVMDGNLPVPLSDRLPEMARELLGEALTALNAQPRFSIPSKAHTDSYKLASAISTYLIGTALSELSSGQNRSQSS